MQQFYMEIKEENPNRRLINGLIAVLTGVFTLIWPDFLPVLIAAYLISTGIVYFFFRKAAFIGAASIVAGIFIFAFENLIPYAFAFFLFILAFGSILSGGLSLIGIMAFIFGLIIISNPVFVTYVIAGFLLFYGLLGLMAWWKKKSNHPL